MTGLFVTSLFAAFKKPGDFIYLVARNWVYMLFLAYVTISVSWASDTYSTMRMSGYFFLSFLVCAAAVIGYEGNFDRALKDLMLCSSSIVLASVFTALLFPQMGVNEMGRWQGVTSHPNWLGGISAICVWAASTYMYYTGSKIIRFLNLALIACCGIALWGSNSVTSSLLASGVIYANTLCFPSRCNAFPWLRVTLASTALFLLVSILCLGRPQTLNPAAILQSFGRDATLTGRTVLWSSAYKSIRENMLTGVGFEEYPSVCGSTRIKHFHNGYLDLLVRGGVLGLFFVCCLFIQVFFRLLKMMRSNWKFCLPAGTFFIFVLAHNTSEGSFGRGMNLMWMLFTFMILFTGSVSRLHRAPADGKTARQHCASTLAGSCPAREEKAARP
jgi:O-antigen ligase